jgi:FPC/CPF motif-containing protein YcgG
LVKAKLERLRTKTASYQEDEKKVRKEILNYQNKLAHMEMAAIAKKEEHEKVSFLTEELHNNSYYKLKVSYRGFFWHANYDICRGRGVNVEACW